MKKLLVLLALLFGTVSVYAAPASDPTSEGGSATGNIYGHLECPISVVGGGDIYFSVPTKKPGDQTLAGTNTMDFDVLASCMDIDPTSEQNPKSEFMHVAMVYTVQEDDVAGTNNTVLHGYWQIDETATPDVDRIKDFTTVGGTSEITENCALWASTPILFKLETVNTATQEWQNANLHWTVTVKATPTDF